MLARAVFVAPLLNSARTWINDPTLATGGPLADIGVHCFDTLRYVLGEEVESVMAQAHYDEHWSVEASGTTLFQFSGGTLGTMSVSARAPYQTLLDVIGEDGVLSAVNALNVEHPVTLELRRGFDLVEKTEVSNANAYTAQVEEFAAAVESGKPFAIPGEEGLQNQLILDAIFRSVKSGRLESPSRYSAGADFDAAWCGKGGGISETFHAQAASRAASSLICVGNHLIEGVGLAMVRRPVLGRNLHAEVRWHTLVEKLYVVRRAEIARAQRLHVKHFLQRLINL